MRSATFNDRNIAIWLIPEQTLRNELIRLQQSLFNCSKDSCIYPHITIFHLNHYSKKFLNEIINEVGFKAFESKINRFAFSDKYFKNLFFEVENNENLKKYYRYFKERFLYIDYYFKPHVSLHYGSLNEKLIDCAEIEPWVGRKIVLDQIALCYAKNGWKDVKNWQLSYI